MSDRKKSRGSSEYAQMMGIDFRARKERIEAAKRLRRQEKIEARSRRKTGTDCECYI